MVWLGVRCWKDRIAMVAVKDGPTPEVSFRRRQKSPARTDRYGPHVAWFYAVTLEAIEEIAPEGVVVRVANTGAEQVRSECEGAVAVAAAHSDLPVRALRQQSMWKPLGVANARSTTWSAFLKSNPLLSTLVVDEKEAACASWAASRR